MSRSPAVHHHLGLGDGRWLHVVVHRPDPGTCSPASVRLPGTLEARRRPTTVVLESGMGLSRLLWARVVPLLTGRGLRVVVYDRAGMGRSPSAEHARGAEELVADLRAVVARTAPGGAVMVGHSYGAILVRLLAASDPGLVRAMVLVDPSTELVRAETTPVGRIADRLAQGVLEGVYRAGLGPLALAATGYWRLPGRMWRKAVVEDSGAEAARSRGAELRPYSAALDGLAASPLPMPAVPVVVLASRSRPGSVWHRAYARYVGSVPGARLVTARTRSHMVPLVDPASVAVAVAGVAGRQGRSTAQPR